MRELKSAEDRDKLQKQQQARQSKFVQARPPKQPKHPVAVELSNIDAALRSFASILECLNVRILFSESYRVA